MPYFSENLCAQAADRDISKRSADVNGHRYTNGFSFQEIDEISTMKIAAFAQYKAVPAFDPIQLPALTILTGLNGSGKSQLLHALHIQNIRCDLFEQLTPPAPPHGMPAGYMQPNSPSGHPQITLLQNCADTDGQFSSERASKLGERFAHQRQARPYQMYDFESKRAELLLSLRKRITDLHGGSLEW